MDIQWYLLNQIHPPIARLLSPIEGTDSALIAMCLGLDPQKMQTNLAGERSEIRIPSSVLISDQEKYRHVHKFHLKCTKCKTEQPEFLGVFVNPPASESNVDYAALLFQGLRCTNCQKEFLARVIQNQLTLFIRKYQKEVRKKFISFFIYFIPSLVHVTCLHLRQMWTTHKTI